MLKDEQKTDLREAIASSNCERSKLPQLMKDLSADNDLAVGFINQYKANLLVEKQILESSKYKMTAYDWYVKEITPKVPTKDDTNDSIQSV